MSQFFTSGGQGIGVSASASVLPMNIQDWFPLGLTGCISLQSRGLSRVFFNTTVQKHQFFGAQLSLGEKCELCVHAKLLQSCPTLCDSMDCSLPGFSVHGILQARTLEWVAMPSSRGSSLSSDQTCISHVSCICRHVLYCYGHLGNPNCELLVNNLELKRLIIIHWKCILDDKLVIVLLNSYNQSLREALLSLFYRQRKRYLKRLRNYTNGI